MPRSLKKETLPAAQGEVSPPAHLCCHKRGSWVPRLPEAGKAGENPSAALGSGAESTEQLPTQDTSTKAVLNAPASRTAQLECGHEPSEWGSVHEYRQRGAPGRNPLVGDITFHPLVRTEPVTWGSGRHRNPSLEDIPTGHPGPRCSPRHHRSPSTCVGGYHNARTHSVPSLLAPGSALVFPARHRGFGHVFPGPRQVALAGADISRHIWRAGSLGNTSGLPGGLQAKVPWVSPHPGTAGQPSGLP